jgi:hypothetical protein
VNTGPLIALSAAAWLAAACAQPPRPAADAEPQPPPDPATQVETVTLERGSCFGTCPVYRVTLDRAGNVRFEGRRFVADSGVSTATVPRERVDSLLAELETAGYFDFADSYRSGDPECPRYATDLPTVITEVRTAGRAKRIQHDLGCSDAPPALSTLETRIDSVAGVQRWTGKS